MEPACFWVPSSSLGTSTRGGRPSRPRREFGGHGTPSLTVAAHWLRDASPRDVKGVPVAPSAGAPRFWGSAILTEGWGAGVWGTTKSSPTLTSAPRSICLAGQNRERQDTTSHWGPARRPWALLGQQDCCSPSSSPKPVPPEAAGSLRSACRAPNPSPPCPGQDGLLLLPLLFHTNQ